MELVTGLAQLHATDVIAFIRKDGKIRCSDFNLLPNKSISSTAWVSIHVNKCDTELKMLNNQQQGCFQFPGGDLRPRSEVLSTIPLTKGKNLIEFHLLEVTSDPVVCSASLWLLDETDRLVVVDIDGTITRSDVRGLVASQIQGTASFLSNAFTSSNPWAPDLSSAFTADYTHEGVREFLTAVGEAGYVLLFLTARPITLADRTREFLATAGRVGDSTLPEGPLITQACGTMKALQAKHEVFKVGVLQQIRELFDEARKGSRLGTETSVFVAGFGNHETDAIAYKAVGIPADRIFMLDKSSKLRVHGTRLEFQSYTGLLPDIDELFPRLPSSGGTNKLHGAAGFAPAYDTSLHQRSHFSIFEDREPASQDPRSMLNLKLNVHQRKEGASLVGVSKTWAGSSSTSSTSPQRGQEQRRSAEETTGWSTRSIMRDLMVGGLSDLSCSRARAAGDGRSMVPQGNRDSGTKPLPLAVPASPSRSAGRGGMAGKEDGGRGSNGSYVHL